MYNNFYLRDQMHWIVDGKKTHSKGRALMWANGDLKKIKFYFNDEEWKDKNYSIESHESFDELAIRQCCNFRENSDCLALWLSGGYDSVTVLKYFIDSKTPLDEIIIYRRDVLEDNEYEYALELAKNYKKNFCSSVKIIFTELIKENANRYYQDFYTKYKHDYVLDDGFSVRFSKNSALFQVENNNDLLRSINLKKKKRMDLLGFEKPRVYLSNDNWFAFYPDSLYYDFAGKANFVGFYTNDFDFYIKQVHMVINWFESLPNFSGQLVHDVQNANVYYQEWNLACGRIIPIKNLWGMHGKHKKIVSMDIFSPDSINQMNNFNNTKILKYYHEGIAMLSHYCKWWSGREDFYKTGTILSNPEFIRKFKNNKKMFK